MSIAQGNGEKLKDSIHHYNLERLDVEDCSDVAITTFTNGLRDKDLVRSL